MKKTHYAQVVVALLWAVLLGAAIFASLYGPPNVREWLVQYGSLLGVLVTAAITSIYLVVTFEQLATTHTLLNVQFGAGAEGPSIKLLREGRQTPPAFRVPGGYELPEEYRQHAFPNAPRKPESENVEQTTDYELIQITNRAENSILGLKLQITVAYSNENRTFDYVHEQPVCAGDTVEIGVWPVLYMPKYRLRVAGDYSDAVGSHQIRNVEVER